MIEEGRARAPTAFSEIDSGRVALPSLFRDGTASQEASQCRETDTPARSPPVARPPPRVPRIDFAALSASQSCVYVVGVACLAAYQPRVAEHGVLYRVIDEHLETFLDAAAQHAMVTGYRSS